MVYVLCEHKEQDCTHKINKTNTRVVQQITEFMFNLKNIEYYRKVNYQYGYF